MLHIVKKNAEIFTSSDSASVVGLLLWLKWKFFMLTDPTVSISESEDAEEGSSSNSSKSILRFLCNEVVQVSLIEDSFIV